MAMTRNSLSPEHREEAVKMVLEPGRPISVGAYGWGAAAGGVGTGPAAGRRTGPGQRPLGRAAADASVRTRQGNRSHGGQIGFQQRCYVAPVFG
jgi:hypothetical protein